MHGKRLPSLIQTKVALGVYCTCIHERTQGYPDAYTQEPLFHFRISSHISESTKNQSYINVPQDSARGDRRIRPTTILLCKSQSGQATRVPKEHKTLMEEAYSAGDHWPRDSGRAVRFQQTPSVPPPEEVLGARTRGSPLSGTLGCQEVWT